MPWNELLFLPINDRRTLGHWAKVPIGEIERIHEFLRQAGVTHVADLILLYLDGNNELWVKHRTDGKIRLNKSRHKDEWSEKHGVKVGISYVYEPIRQRLRDIDLDPDLNLEGFPWDELCPNPSRRDPFWL